MHDFFLPLTEPLGIVWVLMFSGLCYLSVRRRWESAIWLGVPTLLIFILGSTPIAEALVGRAEASCPRTSIASVSRCDALVVLGGGYYVSDNDRYSFAISDGGSRLLTALELMHSQRASALVLGGGLPVPGRPDLVEPSLVQKWIMGEDLARAAVVITNLGTCLNTHDEAIHFQRLQKVYGWQKVLLVTSALHMSRSVAVFRKQGVEVEPVACDFKILGVPDSRRFSLFPRQSRLDILRLLLHEKIGWWVYRGRGWV